MRCIRICPCECEGEKEPTRTKPERIRCDRALQPQPMTDAECWRRLAQLERVLLQWHNARASHSNPDWVSDRPEAK